MSDDEMGLYHPLILEHNRNPNSFQKREDALFVVDAVNPICGDRFKIYFDIEDDHFTKVTFHGYGCSVSMASCSVLVERLAKCQKLNAKNQIANFLKNIGGQEVEIDKDLSVFSVAKKYPGRKTCAVLGWEAVQAFLDTT